MLHSTARIAILMDRSYGKYCVIFDDAEVGVGTRIGNFVLIRDKTRIGKACTIGSYVDIEGDVRIGDFVSLQSGCYITRGVIIEDTVFFVYRVVTIYVQKNRFLRQSIHLFGVAT